MTSADLAQMIQLTGSDRFPIVTVDEVELHLFDGLNGGWPNRPDVRTAMERWRVYTRLDPSHCTYCLRLGNNTRAAGYAARLIDNANMPERYIDTRCPSMLPTRTRYTSVVCRKGPSALSQADVSSRPSMTSGSFAVARRCKPKDPDATLANVRPCLQEGNVGSLERASELFALDEWLSRGGFFPAAGNLRTRDRALAEPAKAAERDVLRQT